MRKSMKIVLFSWLMTLVLLISFASGCVFDNPIISSRPQLETVQDVWDLLHSRYVEPERLDDDVLNQGAIEGLIEALDDPTATYLNPQMGTIEDAWNTLYDNYENPDSLDAELLRQGAISGIMDALNDPYSSYLNPQMYELSISGIEGKFEGIGAYVGIRDGEVTVIAPITDSPAEAAGIKAGDVVLAVEGQSTADMTLNEVVLKIRGPKGSDVTITVRHSGETESIDLTITRDEIHPASVYEEMRDDIAYIHISNFTERTNEELDPVIADINSNGATGIIMDLRNNPGGLLTSVVDVTSRFLDDGYVLHSRDNKGEMKSYSVVNSGEKTDLPMVILTDNFTASASEVFSGALQDYDRAFVAGTVTYGKGSVNTLFMLDDASGVYITTHRWLTPKNRLIEGKGITPDYETQDTELIDWAVEHLHEQAGTSSTWTFPAVYEELNV